MLSFDALSGESRGAAADKGGAVAGTTTACLVNVPPPDEAAPPPVPAAALVQERVAEYVDLICKIKLCADYVTPTEADHIAFKARFIEAVQEEQRQPEGGWLNTELMCVLEQRFRQPVGPGSAVPGIDRFSAWFHQAVLRPALRDPEWYAHTGFISALLEFIETCLKPLVEQLKEETAVIAFLEEDVARLDLAATRRRLGIVDGVERTGEDVIKVMQYDNALAAKLLGLCPTKYSAMRRALPCASATPYVFGSLRGLWMEAKVRPDRFAREAGLLDRVRRTVRLAWKGLKVNGTKDEHYAEIKASCWTTFAAGRAEEKRQRCLANKRQRTA